MSGDNYYGDHGLTVLRMQALRLPHLPGKSHRSGLMNSPARSCCHSAANDGMTGTLNARLTAGTILRNATVVAKEPSMIEGIFQPMHLLLIFAIALLIFGPGKLPDLGKALGESIREFKKAIANNEERSTTAVETPEIKSEQKRSA
jgi:sec-independent protein translocase protein TatA